MTIYIPQFDNSRVLVVGDVMLDRYWHGSTTRISPEAPVPVVKVTDIEDRPGGAANVALNIAKLGGKPIVVGATGGDAAADALRTELRQAGVETDFECVGKFSTITKLRVLSLHQQLIRLDFEDGFPELDPALLLARFQSHLDSAACVVMSDYDKGALRHPQPFIAAARGRGLPTVVDPKGNDFSRYRGASVITPNRQEFESAVGACEGEAELVRRGQDLLERFEFEALLITRGEEGMNLIIKGAEPLHMSAEAREVYDVTGAGDTVVSVLAAGLAAGMELSQAAVLANTAAGIVVGKLGTATISVAELRHTLFEHQELQRGVVGEDELMRLVNNAREQGERIVMTNGCFDILHAGHVNYLEQASGLGDRLLVAVNGDASVRRLKGETRPVHSQEQRMDVLAGLGAVDWVVPFDEDTPERLICRVKPDVLVKGGDNEPDKIPGSRCVREAGGEVVVTGYLEGVSTSATIARIRSQ
jgi:D-beta-D-heptose 7-phosphate kinase/D-beta-D-heptose 1-phosphate adenosyltransferase